MTGRSSEILTMCDWLTADTTTDARGQIMNVEYWVAVVKPNRILFELDYFDRDIAVHALELAAQKLPIKVKVVEKTEA